MDLDRSADRFGGAGGLANPPPSVAHGDTGVKGFYGATVRLEHLWHRLCAENSFTLFCAYPKINFAENGSEAIAHICPAHSKILAA
jgi:hypothetical protein